MQNKLFGSRAFYRRVLAVGVPIMVQNAITNFVSLLDNVMIGRVGTVEMSGVAIANQLLFVFNLIVFGAVAGAGIFGAQFYGNNDMDGVQHTMRFKLIICTVLTGICIAVLAAFGPQLIGLYLKGEGRIEDAEASLKFGLEYMRVMYIGLIPYAITQAYAATLRETGETLLPMKAGIVAVLVNLTFNYILIFGHFGAPRMGVVGAAIATVLSRFVELAIVVIWTHRHTARFPYINGLYRSMHIPCHLFWDIVRRGTPLLLNEGLWAAGMAMLNQCYSLRSLDVVAATNISSTIWNVFACVYLAFGNTISIMVGQELGAGEILARGGNGDVRGIRTGQGDCTAYYVLFGGNLDRRRPADGPCRNLFPADLPYHRCRSAPGDPVYYRWRLPDALYGPDQRPVFYPAGRRQDRDHLLV